MFVFKSVSRGLEGVGTVDSLLCVLSVSPTSRLEQLDHGLPGLAHSDPLH